MSKGRDGIGKVCSTTYMERSTSEPMPMPVRMVARVSSLAGDSCRLLVVMT